MKRKDAMAAAVTGTVAAMLLTVLTGGGCASLGDRKFPLDADISPSQMCFFSDQDNELRLNMTLVNRSMQVVDPRLEDCILWVNDLPLKESRDIVRAAQECQFAHLLPPGRRVRFTYTMRMRFNRAGLYDIKWTGDQFESKPVRIRVRYPPGAGT